MANTERRYTDGNGNMFIPMNVEGGSWNENFITTPKLITLAVSICSGIAIIAWLRSVYADASAYVIIMGLWLFVFQFILRYIIFEERFYYKMYKELIQSEISTPDVFWSIASMRDTDDGCLLTYMDGKVGVIVKLERDTITGKTEDFRETHYDSLSDFYKDLGQKGYSFVQMNIMEQAGNDPRLMELDKLTYSSDNENLCKLMETKVGYIKNISHRTLYESDYFLIYSRDINRLDNIVTDVVESIYKVLGGAFIGYRFLNNRDIIELNKEDFGVKYFDSTKATLSIYRNNSITCKRPFKITGIEYSDGDKQVVGNKELTIINTITSDVINGTLDISKVAIKDTIFPKEVKEVSFEGVDFDTLANNEISEDELDFGNDNKKGKKRFFGRKNKGKNKKEIKEEENNDIGFVEDFDFEDFDIHSKETSEKNNVNNNEKIKQENDNFFMDFNEFEDDDETIDF